MSMVMAGPSLSLLLLMGGQIGLPLGLPPAPEDPVMASVAPQECLWYFTWSGVAEPDPKTTNQTEQLLAEPEVRDFIRGVGKALSAAIRKGAPPTPQGKLLGAEGPSLIRALLTHPTAAFISKAGIGPMGLDVAAGIVVGTGDETDHVRTTLDKLETTLLGPGATAAGATWHRLPIPPGAPTIEWGFHGKYLIVGIGEGSADAIAVRTAGQPPEWLVAIKKKLAVERVSTVHYLNVKKAVAAAQAASPAFAQVQNVLEALGLGSVQQFANVTGLEGTGCVSKSWVKIDGEPSGLLTVFGPEALTAADLSSIPKDASFAIAARMKPDRLWTSILESVNKIDAKSGEEFAAGVKQVESLLGFRFQEDLFQTLGDSWCIYNSPGEGGLLITGLTVVVPVKDHDRLAKTNDQLVQFVRKNTPPVEATQQNRFVPRGPTINDTTFQKQKIFYLNLFGGEMPFVLSWCITDKQLILSLSPQNIRAVLSRDPAAGSLADLPAVAAKIKSDSPLLITYQDTAGMMKITYPLLQMFATMGFSEMQREGLDLDGAVLPSLASLVRHIEPGMSTLSQEKDGLVYVSRQSMPVDLTLSGLLPAWSGMMFLSFRGMESARSAAMKEADVERTQIAEAQPVVRATTPIPPTENDRIAAPVVYDGSMLILSSKDGVAAIAFDEQIELGIKYRFRFRPNGGGKEQSGAAKVFEKYKRLPSQEPGGGKVVIDEGSELFIKAGPIKLEWSRSDDGRGFVYYQPENFRVQIGDAKTFDTVKLQRFAWSTTPEEDAETKEEHAPTPRPVQRKTATRAIPSSR